LPRHRVSPSSSPRTSSCAVSTTPRLIDSISDVSGILDHALSRTMTVRDTLRADPLARNDAASSHSRHITKSAASPSTRLHRTTWTKIRMLAITMLAPSNEHRISAAFTSVAFSPAGTIRRRPGLFDDAARGPVATMQLYLRRAVVPHSAKSRLDHCNQFHPARAPFAPLHLFINNKNKNPTGAGNYRRAAETSRISFPDNAFASRRDVPLLAIHQGKEC